MPAVAPNPLFFFSRYLAAKAELAGLESEILALARTQEQDAAMSEVSLLPDFCTRILDCSLHMQAWLPCCPTQP